MNTAPKQVSHVFVLHLIDMQIINNAWGSRITGGIKSTWMGITLHSFPYLLLKSIYAYSSVCSKSDKEWDFTSLLFPRVKICLNVCIQFM